MKFDIEDFQLLSFFETFPKQLDNSKNIPTYYKESTFTFKNEKDYIEFTITPSIGELEIKVTEIESDNCYFELTLLDIEEFNILKDTSEEKVFEILDDNKEKEIISKYIITLRPTFSMKLIQTLHR